MANLMYKPKRKKERKEKETAHHVIIMLWVWVILQYCICLPDDSKFSRILRCFPYTCIHLNFFL